MILTTKDYLRLRSKGLSPLTALQNSRKHISVAEKIVFFTILVFMLALLIANLYASYQYIQTEADYKVSKIANTLSKERVILNTYESMIVNCLNGNSVNIEGRDKQCQIKEFKEAIS